MASHLYPRLSMCLRLSSLMNGFSTSWPVFLLLSPRLAVKGRYWKKTAGLYFPIKDSKYLGILTPLSTIALNDIYLWCWLRVEVRTLCFLTFHFRIQQDHAQVKGRKAIGLTSKVSRVSSAIPRTYHQETAEIDNTRSFSAHSGSGGLFQVKPARSERFSRRSKGSAPSMWRGNRQHGAAS